MKILFINMCLDQINGGGTVERTIQLSKHIASEGADCTILTTDVGLKQDLVTVMKSNNVDIIALPCINKRFYLLFPCLKTIKKQVAASDIIHLMGHWTLINLLIYLYARIYNKPYAVCPAGALPVFGRSKSIKALYNLIVGRKIISNANLHIAVGENEISHFAEYGISAEQVAIIPNGVNPNDYLIQDSTAFRMFAELANSPYILFMGRLNPIKGPDLLLNAFCRVSNMFPDMHLVFAGPDGGMLNELKSLAQSSSFEERIHFVGHLGGANKVSAYSAASIFVVPSRQEAMSIVALESGICGVPVLMTDQCGFGALSSIGGGMIVPATEQGLTHGLISLLEDRKLLPIMGERFKVYILNNLTWQVAAKAHLQLFEKVGGIDV